VSSDNAAVGIEAKPLHANQAPLAIVGLHAKPGVLALVRLYFLRRRAHVEKLVLDAVARKRDPGFAILRLFGDGRCRDGLNGDKAARASAINELHAAVNLREECIVAAAQ
jgi:hypothetical protein